jgi:hypothetical protein
LRQYAEERIAISLRCRIEIDRKEKKDLRGTCDYSSTKRLPVIHSLPLSSDQVYRCHHTKIRRPKGGQREAELLFLTVCVL